MTTIAMTSADIIGRCSTFASCVVHWSRASYTSFLVWTRAGVFYEHKLSDIIYALGNSRERLSTR